MKIQVPWFVETDNQAVWVLCTFLRRLYIEYDISSKLGLALYLKDVKVILDIEHRNVGKYLEDHLHKDWGMVGRLELQTYTFYPKAIIKHTKHLELTDPRAIRVWCYLMGCLNHNLIEPPGKGWNNKSGKPSYQAMNHMDREFFRLSSRVDEEA